MAAFTTNNTRPQDNKAMLQSIAQTVSMFGGEESRALFEQIYAKEIAVDYTGQGGDVSDRTQMAQWAAALPGFDHTRYTLSDVSLQLRLQGSQLTAQVRIHADRWVDDLFLEIEKSYQHQVDVQRVPSQVLSRTLESLSHTGSWKEVTTNKNRARELVETFLGGIYLGRFEMAGNTLSENALLYIRTETLGQEKFYGRQRIVDSLRSLMGQGHLIFAKDWEVIADLDGGEAFFVRWKGGAGHFTVRDNLIVRVQTFLA